MQEVQYSKTCITLKSNLQIDWKFGKKLICLHLLNNVTNITSQNDEMNL